MESNKHVSYNEGILIAKQIQLLSPKSYLKINPSRKMSISNDYLAVSQVLSICLSTALQESR